LNVNNNRRRLVAAFSAGAVLLPFSRVLQASTELPECKYGDFIRNGWQANWSSQTATVTDTKDAKITKHVSEALTIRSRTKYSAVMESDPIFNLKLYYHDVTKLSIDAIPSTFSLGESLYRIVSSDGYDVYGKVVSDSSYSDEDKVHVTLSRGKVKKSVQLSGSSGSLSLPEKDIESLLEYGDKPLMVSLVVKNKTVLSRQYDVNGILTAYSLAKEKHLQEQSREYADECENNDMGCFLTTATCGHIGLSDDCWELSTLRAFRDNYMMTFESGRRQMEEYYRIAPSIVEGIRCQSDARRTYLKMYWRFILPSALLIKLGMVKKAHRRYIQMLDWTASQLSV
jgi:hypothetical protein